MSEILLRTPSETAKLLRPGSIRKVHLLFQTRTGHVSLVKVAKSSLERMLKQLPADASISIEIMHGFRTATIAGGVSPVKAGDLSPAASVARRLEILPS